jgi:hypothetical protein
MLSGCYAECHRFALYAECHYAECRYAECHGALTIVVRSFVNLNGHQLFCNKCQCSSDLIVKSFKMITIAFYKIFPLSPIGTTTFTTKAFSITRLRTTVNNVSLSMLHYAVCPFVSVS